MSYCRHQNQFTRRVRDREPVSLMSFGEYFVLDTETGGTLPCKNSYHARAMSVVKNKEVHSWHRYVPCHQNHQGFQMLEV